MPNTPSQPFGKPSNPKVELGPIQPEFPVEEPIFNAFSSNAIPGPRMGITFNQTNTAAICGASAGCSGVAITSGPQALLAVRGGNFGTTPVNVTVGPFDGSNYASLMFELIPGDEFRFWEAGTWTIPVRITSLGGSFFTATGLHICRFDSQCNSVQTVGNAGGLFSSLSVGINTFTVDTPRVAVNAGDKAYIILTVANFLIGGVSFTIVPDQIITTPIVKARRMFFCDVDLNNNRFVNAAIDEGTHFPLSPIEGQLFYRTDYDRLYICTNATTPVWTDDMANYQDGQHICFGAGEGINYHGITGTNVQTVQASFVYPGSSKWIPQNMKVVLSRDAEISSASTYGARIYDYTNNHIIADTGLLTLTTSEVLTTWPIIGPLPPGEAVWQVQTIRNPGVTSPVSGRLHTVKLDRKPTAIGAGSGYLGGGIDFSAANYSTIEKLNFADDSVYRIGSGLTGTRILGAAFASTRNGYFVGGQQGATFLTRIDKLNFFYDSISTNTSGMTGTRSSPVAAFESTAAGFWCGGTAAANVSTIQKLVFSDDTVANITSTLSGTRSLGVAGFTSSSAGYACGGFQPSVALTTINKLAYSNEARTTITSGLTTTKTRGVAGFESSTVGYALGGARAGTIPVSTVDKLTFSNDSVVTNTSGLTGTRYDTGAGFGGKVAGYGCGGVLGNDAGVLTTIDKLTFSNESIATNSSGITISRAETVGGFENAHPKTSGAILA